jgi:hypothetical protein
MLATSSNLHKRPRHAQRQIARLLRFRISRHEIYHNHFLLSFGFVRHYHTKMKLVIAGASGFVATELIRQSLALPQITSVVALARRPISVPENLGAGDSSKLRSAVVKDYNEYPDDVKKELADADACIWYSPCNLRPNRCIVA